MPKHKLDLTKTIKETLKARGFAGPIADAMATRLVPGLVAKAEAAVSTGLTEPVILKAWKEAQADQAAAPAQSKGAPR
jgi:hypothetical protein